MHALETPSLISVADYLDGELRSPIKHEYLGGVVYAMAGAKNTHNRIASNATGSLWNALRGDPCEAFNSDTKVRIQYPTYDRFYYPDVSVVCHSNPPDDTYQDHPVAIVEVISDSTRRTDQFEKRDAYLTIPTLMVYLLVEQDRPLVTAYRRGDEGFNAELHRGPDASIPLDELAPGIILPLSALYRGVTFPTTPATD